ncbi:MAG: EAL domain-containing protein [Campylobacterales bacterium]|nr:EAL domain-containing protein [Campylobacterales bacterium]
MTKHRLESIRLEAILENSPDGMFTIDTNMNIQYTNPAFCQLVGYSESELYGTPISNYLGDLSILTHCMTSVQECGHCRDQETIFRRKDGSIVHISKNVQALYDNEGNMDNILVSIRDMTALHQLNKELLASKYEILTKLPNRRKLLSDISDIDSAFTIILINIDSFKEFNTFYGHKIADQLLITLGSEIVNYSQTIPLSSVVYKLPVDEYAILIKCACSREEVDQCITALSTTFNTKIFTVADQEISLNITIGVAGSTVNATQINDIMTHADMALKLAKKTRKNYLYYDESLLIKENYENNLSWIKRLRNAIDEDRVIPFYQPIVNAQTLKIEKYEALIRIVEEDGTIISPFKFLEISKKVKLYHQLTTIMIDKVFKELANHDKVQCSINLSIEDIHDNVMYNYIVNKIKHYPHSDRIIFEILESEGIGNYETINQFITEVKQYGVKIAIDDFGAGYSNFVYITKLDIDYIKIDGSIIRNIHKETTSQIITKTIIDFASQLGIQSVAEFVCDENVYNYLKQLPISHFQGYYFGEPNAMMVTE